MYKVCILTAGRGTRNKYARINKALLPIGDGTALSYVINKFPLDTEIILAVGYNADKVIKYADTLGRNISYVHAKYEGIGSGPGYSLLCCRDYLQCPFIYMACDTLVLEDIPSPEVNWMGVSLVDKKLPYLTVDFDGWLVNEVYDKGNENATYMASIGLVGVNDYGFFWEGLANRTLVQNEHQDTSGLNALIPHGLHALNFTWFDIGSTEGYEYVGKRFGSVLSG